MSLGISAKDLITYKATYEKQLQKLEVIHKGKVDKLNKSYAEMLQKLLLKVQRSGDFKNAIAVKNEQERFVKANVIIDSFPDNSKLSKAVLPYLKRYLKLKSFHAKSFASLAQKYKKILLELQRKLVISGKLDEAKSIQKEIKKNDELLTLIIDTKPKAAAEKPKYTEKELIGGVILLAEKSFNLNRDDLRIMEIPIEVPYIKFGKIEILIQVENAFDDSGDAGMTYRLLNGKKRVKKGFTNSRGWYDIKYVARSKDKLTFYLEDKDTSLEGNSPGNKGKIRITCKKK